MVAAGPHPCVSCDLGIATHVEHHLSMQDESGKALDGYVRIRCTGDKCQVCLALKLGGKAAVVTISKSARVAPVNREEEE